ncbi:hypothetical protein DFR24_3685 [Panacagrimonas perspica]|uniref:Uncharacterized protein n=1 Tax=Panacagrimonas perspica TaxID=381431 RepID=A0A4V3F4U7_9GAMM|nr:hypothetical protein DFR24_3685 [Panacagrimonas perspica]
MLERDAHALLDAASRVKVIEAYGMTSERDADATTQRTTW